MIRTVSTIVDLLVVLSIVALLIAGCGGRPAGEKKSAAEYQQAVKLLRAENAELKQQIESLEAEADAERAKLDEYQAEAIIAYDSLGGKYQNLLDIIASQHKSAKEAFGALNRREQDFVKKMVAKLYANEPIPINPSSGASLMSQDPFGFIERFIEIGTPLHKKFKEALARQAEAGGWKEINTTPPPPEPPEPWASKMGKKAAKILAPPAKEEKDRRRLEAIKKHKREQAEVDAAEAKRKVKIEAAEIIKKAEAEKAMWRDWQNKDGKVLFFARFSGVINNKVVLKTVDQTTEYVDLDTLSKEDCRWIDDYLRRTKGSETNKGVGSL